jgi:hypothetical protein
VLADGRVMGTWRHVSAGRTLNVSIEPFGRMSAKMLAEVRRDAESLAGSLGLAGATVKLA